jgi:hypothetical protein
MKRDHTFEFQQDQPGQHDFKHSVAGIWHDREILTAILGIDAVGLM